MRTKRQGIIVWFEHRRNIKQIRRYGHLIYASRKLRYAVLYVDQVKVEKIEQKLKTYSFVKKIERSYRPFLKTHFDQEKPEEEKRYDYKMGI